MNQAIQFTGREWWDETMNAVCFTAIADGLQVTCAIHGESLIRRYGGELPAPDLFRLHRWDLEDEAEEAIKAEKADNQGWVWLS